MKKIIYIVFILLFNCKSFSQDVIGRWKIINFSDADTETYSDVIWEFTSNNKCIWREKVNNNIVFEFTYSISNKTCDDDTVDGDLHLKLIDIADGEKTCYVFFGIINKNGRITMSINEYGEAERILFVKE